MLIRAIVRPYVSPFVYSFIFFIHLFFHLPVLIIAVCVLFHYLNYFILVKHLFICVLNKSLSFIFFCLAMLNTGLKLYTYRDINTSISIYNTEIARGSVSMPHSWPITRNNPFCCLWTCAPKIVLVNSH